MKKKFTLLVILLLSMVAIIGCGTGNTVQPGDKVSISYIAAFPDGSIFQTSESGNTLNFIVGQEEVITGLDKGVVGMKLNETNTILIKAEDGYAKDYNKSMEQKVSKTIFDKLNIQAKEGEIQTLGDIQGMVRGTEKDKDGNEFILFDVNPKQTYQDLSYKVTIEKLEKTPKPTN